MKNGHLSEMLCSRLQTTHLDVHDINANHKNQMTDISARTITSMQNVNILRNASAAPATRTQLLLSKVASITTRLQSRRARWPKHQRNNVDNFEYDNTGVFRK